ncbi:MAG: hypothetical protein AAGM22_11880 [Acidobacteriota bacterium]
MGVEPDFESASFQRVNKRDDEIVLVLVGVADEDVEVIVHLTSLK